VTATFTGGQNCRIDFCCPACGCAALNTLKHDVVVACIRTGNVSRRSNACCIQPARQPYLANKQRCWCCCGCADVLLFAFCRCLLYRDAHAVGCVMSLVLPCRSATRWFAGRRHARNVGGRNAMPAARHCLTPARAAGGTFLLPFAGCCRCRLTLLTTGSDGVTTGWFRTHHLPSPHIYLLPGRHLSIRCLPALPLLSLLPGRTFGFEFTFLLAGILLLHSTIWFPSSFHYTILYTYSGFGFVWFDCFCRRWLPRTNCWCLPCNIFAVYVPRYVLMFALLIPLYAPAAYRWRALAELLLPSFLVPFPIT